MLSLTTTRILADACSEITRDGNRSDIRVTHGHSCWQIPMRCKRGSVPGGIWLGCLTLKTYQMFSVHTTPEEFQQQSNRATEQQSNRATEQQSNRATLTLRVSTSLKRWDNTTLPSKQRQRRRQDRRLVTNELIFFQQNSRLSRSLQYANGSEKVLSLNMQWQRSIPNVSTEN